METPGGNPLRRVGRKGLVLNKQGQEEKMSSKHVFSQKRHESILNKLGRKHLEPISGFY